MKVGDLVQCTVQHLNAAPKTIGLITDLGRNSMNSSDKYTKYYVYWSHLDCTDWASYSDLEVVSESV